MPQEDKPTPALICAWPLATGFCANIATIAISKVKVKSVFFIDIPLFLLIFRSECADMLIAQLPVLCAGIVTRGAKAKD
jgi:hypothetical protein